MIIRYVTRVEASDIGIGVEFPATVKYEGWDWTNPEPEYREVGGEKELVSMTYHCNGRRLIVYND
jgi:hypothetical protein